MPGPIVFINPNGLSEVTRHIELTVSSLRTDADPDVKFETLATVPGGITTQRDSDRAAVAVANFVADNERTATAFVICCYSDPGLHAARETTRKPVIGIGATGLSMALARGERAGVIVASSSGVPRHWRAYNAARLARAVAGERAVDISVGASGSAAALQELVKTGRALRDVDGADVIVLGCAGMTPLRAEIEEALGLPVIDPCSAAAILVFGSCRERRVQAMETRI